MFSKLFTMYSAPRAFENAFIAYLRSFEKTITKEKTINSIITMHQRAIVTLTTQQFFTGQAITPLVNTNLQSFIRPEGEHFIIEAIRIYEGAGATINAIDWIPGLTTADVLNGFLTLVENGVVYLGGSALFPLTEFNQSTTNERWAGIFELDDLIIWGGQESLEITCRWATAPATANQALRIELLGMGLLA